MTEVATLRDAYVAALVKPDARAARRLISEALAAGTDPYVLYLDVLAPALHEIGRRWARAEIGVAAEHIASTTTEAVMADLAGVLQSGGVLRGSAVVACVGEELHRLGSRVVADFLEADGWDVIYLGAMVPVEQIVKASRGAALVALSMTMSARAPDLIRVCEALREQDPPPFIAVGGQGLAGIDVPADLVAQDPRALVAAAAALPAVAGRPRDAAETGAGGAGLYAGESELVKQVLSLNDDLLKARREIAHVAEALQRSLLPDVLPAVEGVSLEARYAPGTTDRVGGDWYDAMVLPGGELALVIGDVAGKGVRAAARMGEIRSAVRAYLLDETDPSLVLTRVNRLVERGEEMVTALVGILEPATGRWRHASAGHLPPLQVADGGAAYLAGGRGGPLMVHEKVEPFETRLATGARLLLFTDGLVEHRDEPIDHSLERLRMAAAEGADLDGLLAIAPGGEARDDLAVLAVELSARRRPG